YNFPEEERASFRGAYFSVNNNVNPERGGGLVRGERKGMVEGRWGERCVCGGRERGKREGPGGACCGGGEGRGEEGGGDGEERGGESGGGRWRCWQA
ncbi:UNVERIFIED_CONTAM: hypothetical protein DV099_10450, partial [Bifidobacterium longum]|nr:hypothetical protein [Bifidobacterium longum]